MFLFSLFLPEDRSQNAVHKVHDAAHGACDAERDSAGHGGAQRRHYAEHGAQAFRIPDASIGDAASRERDALSILVEKVGVDLGGSLDGLPGSAQRDVSELQVLGVRGANAGGEPDLFLFGFASFFFLLLLEFSSQNERRKKTLCRGPLPLPPPVSLLALPHMKMNPGKEPKKKEKASGKEGEKAQESNSPCWAHTYRHASHRDGRPGWETRSAAGKSARPAGTCLSVGR